MRDEKRTLDCLKKGARIASQCLDTGVQVQLYVELLNQHSKCDVSSEWERKIEVKENEEVAATRSESI